MKSSLLKNTFREIWHTKARFLSILAIIALGVGFFTGIKATSPAMNKTAINYYKEQNLMDFRLLSSVGFDDNDVSAIKEVKGIRDISAGYFADVIVNVEGTGNAVRMYALPTATEDKTPINSPVLLEGRLPEKSGEIVIETKYAKQGFSVGDKIKIEPTVGDKDTFSMLNTLDYTIVGVIESPMYISFERGSTVIGNGSISSFVYVLPEDFAYERYTEVYITTDYSGGNISPFSDEYKDGINTMKKQLEEISKTRLDVFDEEHLSGARKKLTDGVAKYKESEEKAKKELEKAQVKLDSGEKEYNEKIKQAEKDLQTASSQISSGEEKLPGAIQNFYDGISDAKEQINDAENKLNEGKAELKQAKKEYNDKISAANIQITEGKKQYEAAAHEFYTYTKPQAEKKIEALEKLMAKVEKAISDLEKLLEKTPCAEKLKEDLATAKQLFESYKMEFDHGKQQLIDGEKQLVDTKEKLDNAEIQYNEQKASGAEALQDAEEKIADGQAQLDSAKEQYYAGKSDGKKQLNSAQEKLEDGKEQITAGQKRLKEEKQKGLDQLKKGKEELKKAKDEAENKLSEAKIKLEDAQKELDKYSAMKWYVNTRDDNPGYSGLLEDTNRVDAVATVFPLFFLLVAALVCLTTMTRMVEERRTEIGTFKALGYSPIKIASKYLVYATVAGLTGCAVGIALGLPILPNIIFNAYELMYVLPALQFVVPWDIIAYGVLAAVLCTSIVALVTCYKSLKLRPAKLMRPKAPKAGKRILLERIPWIWSKFGFTSKVTARNLFRYKVRLLMTVLGVAGCTALIVAGFGLKDAIGVIVDKQFNEIVHYNTVIIPKTAGTEEELKTTYDEIIKDNRVDDLVLARQEKVSVDNPKKQGEKISDVSVVTPSSIKDCKSMIDMHVRQTGEPIKLTDEGVVVTEKLADTLGLKVGDKITYVDSDQTYKMKITGICENYMFNYIYLSPTLYNQTYNRDIKFNMMLGILGDTNTDIEEAFATETLKREDITAVTFTKTGVETFQNMIVGLNTIVFVMIFCAGALAFVVLYNLTNINIAERQREIATIKVLGFYNKEVGSYVYRENIVLTILGIICGLLLGIVLNTFIIQTVEIDKVMFGREIMPQSFVYAAGLTALFSLIVNWIMYFKMKVISMVESLKSIE